MPTTTRLRARWILPIVVLAVLLAAACGGDSEGPIDPLLSDTTLTVSLDGGAAFTAATANITSAAGRLLIVASSGPNESMGLGFELRTGQQASGTGGTATASYVLLGTGAWAAGPNLAASSGSLTLTTATANHVVGTFNFTLVSTVASTPPTRQMTSGRIDIRY